ncbi:MAG: hypothetical protein KGO92_10285 [Bacteroidota bacterium]|nr:hypothetical protein [Bacteroidota bacterium]
MKNECSQTDHRHTFAQMQKTRYIFPFWKRLMAACMLVSLLLQTFQVFAVVGDYYLNTSAYAKNCINKARPQMHCNGKCQMMKKIKQEEKKSARNPEKPENKNPVISSKSFFASLTFLYRGKTIPYIGLLPGFPVNRSYPIFHPPGRI